jgi:abnormal spindle-like microcephaly-associated protein
MSGFLNEAVTPCPWKSGSARFNEHNSGSDTFDSLLDETPFENTGEIEFTTEVRAPVLTGTRPRRVNKTKPTFHIREESEDASVGREKRRRTAEVTKSSVGRKSSLLAQPAQRFRPNVSFAQETKEEMLALPKASGVGARNKNKHSTILGDKDPNKKSVGDPLKKGVRRNTVYIPPDDTTVPDVFMGLFSPLKQQSRTSKSQTSDNTEINSFESQIVKRQVRKSLAASARRAPLQQSLRVPQVDPTAPDIPGTGGGKENLPPGKFTLLKDKDRKSDDIPSKPRVARRTATNATASQTPATRQPRSTTVASANHTTTARHRGGQKEPLRRMTLGETQGNAAMAPKEPVRRAVPLSTRASPLPDRPGDSHSSQNVWIEHINPTLRKANQRFSLLAENIAEPALYEDNWLSHQETVISQLVNGLFEYSDSNLTSYDANTLRLDLLNIYHTGPFVDLYKRLQGSLSCGALRIPKETLTRGTRLHQDLGLKRRFLDIWIQSYNLCTLVPALETVVGRQISDDSTWLVNGLNDGPGSASLKKMVIRTVEEFLETFLLRNEDIDQPTTSFNDHAVEGNAKIYHRAVLRSIMLVALLDKGKECLGANFPRRLFQSSSDFKSSADVFRALLRLLIPSCGDINRLFAHLNCRLSHKQHPLQEYNYKINTMAVDFRDGVRLARIVELLLLLPQHPQSVPDASTQISLPTGEVFSLTEGNPDLPLSQHLKFPCVSHAVKIFNVRLVLGALASQKGAASVLNNIQAEDIVLGYREKTIALLWALLSKWGLAGLVDWDDVRMEITRLKHKAVAQLGYEAVKDETWFLDKESLGDEHADLLQQWAGILAALQGLRVNNLTTSFANGKVYGGIMDEYEPYIAGGISESEYPSLPFSSMSLESRLKQLGCSSQFGKYFGAVILLSG